MNLKNNLSTKTGWEIIENVFDQEQIITTGSNYLIGNGYLGYRGTFVEWQSDQYTGCIVTDTYDNANGKWKELCNVPNGLYTRVFLDQAPLAIFPDQDQPYQRIFNLRNGVLSRTQNWQIHHSTVGLKTERFASFDQHHLIALQYDLEFPKLETGTKILLQTGIDGQVWSLQGDHFKSLEMSNEDDRLICEIRTVEEDIEIVVVEGTRISGCQLDGIDYIQQNNSIHRHLQYHPSAGEQIHLEKCVVIYTSNDVQDPKTKALQLLDEALERGYQDLKNIHQARWDRFWSTSDLKITGNLEDQILVRFNLYHNMIATPTHTTLPIGARGLSTQVYQGAAFWDQEIFNLPMFIYTQPDVARNILKYRYVTLDGARQKAKRLGYRGAFYAWTSGKTGKELFPDFFFTDVLTNRKIRNHFNDWQIHISPDIVYAIWSYYQATTDFQFLIDYGAEIIFEIARFLYSHAYFKPEKDQYEFIRLLGPDEYHENVDNNAFTNYQAHFSLRKAVDIYHLLKNELPSSLIELSDRIDLLDDEVKGWQDMVEKLYLPQPDPETGLIEQFDGFFDLEDITPDQLRKRLIHPDEYWGWPNGIAVHAQVLKQADVVQLLSLHDLFPQDIIQKNFDYYEPRTEHGSSLSPSVHALVACKAGYLEKAYRYFKESASIDLYQMSKKVISGGSFLGGIHTAACGATWEIVTMGFAGFSYAQDILTFRPLLPTSWEKIEFNLMIKGQHISIQVDHDTIELRSHPSNKISLPCSAFQSKQILNPGKKVRFIKNSKIT